MFVLQRGSYSPAKMEYSYGRRAQSVTHTLQWRDVAIIDTENLTEAIAEARQCVADWNLPGRWRIEGRGKNIKICQEL